jgi:DNA-binding NarL/FixJ family response regulator
MSRLKILMADDQQIEIEEARRALKEMDHEVVAVATFDEAATLAQNEAYDIAVVDLGWYGDKSLKKQLSEEDLAAAGWKILNLVKAKNPNTVRILYSARTDEPKITQTATEQGIYCIQKRFTKEGRLQLADVVKVIAHHLSVENDLKERIKELELVVEKNRALVRDLQAHQNKTDSDERQFRRVLITTIITPTVAFILFIAAWLLTRQVYVAILAFVGGSFLSLAALRAMGTISSSDLKYLGKLLPSLFHKS